MVSREIGRTQFVRYIVKIGEKERNPAVSTLLTPVSLYFLVWCRPETGDRFEKGERQSVYSTVGEHSVLPFLDISAVLGYLTATHAVSSPQAQHKVNCPKGKRRCTGM